MKKEYDFSQGKRGPVVPVQPGKTRITIRIDTDIVNWFREQVNSRGGGNYQTMMNEALRAYVDGKQESLEVVVRRVVKEELKKGMSKRHARGKKAA